MVQVFKIEQTKILKTLRAFRCSDSVDSSIQFKDSSGKTFQLSDFKGKVLLVVNIASKCGFAPQLKSLNELHEKYHHKGLEILVFPSNDFNQEPLEGNEMQAFCEINYGLQFKVMEKCHVKGNQQHPLFQYLSSRSEHKKFTLSPLWNFQKYLVDKKGRLVDFYLPITSPTSKHIVRKMEKLL